MEEVSTFVVVAPASMGKAVEYAQDRIRDRLARSFPDYHFAIEAFGPLADDEGFSVYPVTGTLADKGDGKERVYMCKPLEPWVIPAIKEVLKEFELTPGLH